MIQVSGLIAAIIFVQMMIDDILICQSQTIVKTWSSQQGEDGCGGDHGWHDAGQTSFGDSPCRSSPGYLWSHRRGMEE